METESQTLTPLLDNFPFFENHDHAISWIDKALTDIEGYKKTANEERLNHLNKLHYYKQEKYWKTIK